LGGGGTGTGGGAISGGLLRVGVNMGFTIGGGIAGGVASGGTGIGCGLCAATGAEAVAAIQARQAAKPRTDMSAPPFCRTIARFAIAPLRRSR
jgi:hypothetical protein